MAQQNSRSLHVRNFSVHKRDLNILVDVNLLRPKIDDLIRRANRGFNLIGRLPFLYLLRFRRRSLLLLLPLSSTSASALIICLLIVPTAALLSATLLSAILV